MKRRTSSHLISASCRNPFLHISRKTSDSASEFTNQLSASAAPDWIWTSDISFHPTGGKKVKDYSIQQIRRPITFTRIDLIGMGGKKKSLRMLDLLLLLWKAGGGLKCGSMFHLDEWVAPPSPPPPEKKLVFIFSSCRVVYNNTITESIQPPVLTLHWWGVMANWRPSSGWMVQTMLRRTGESKAPGVLHFDVCAYLYIWYWYIWLGNPGERVVMRMPLYVCSHFLSSDLIGFFGWERRGCDIFDSDPRSREYTHTAYLSISLWVWVWLSISERKEKFQNRKMDSDFSCPENGNGTDYASSADDSTLTQVSTGW
jgi:hypothetical protein